MKNGIGKFSTYLKSVELNRITVEVSVRETEVQASFWNAPEVREMTRLAKQMRMYKPVSTERALF
jgi:hypothetical protein